MDYTNVLKNISRTLRDLRKSKHLTQFEVVKQIGELNISERTLKTYESKNLKLMPDLDKLMMLSEFYGVSIDYILSGRNTSYDDSFSKADCLKSLIKLIYSSCIVAEKTINICDELPCKYVLMPANEEISLMLDRIINEGDLTFINTINGQGPFDLSKVFTILNDIPNLKDDWGLSQERLAKSLEYFGCNPKKYFLDRIKHHIERTTSESTRNKLKDLYDKTNNIE